MLPLLLAFPPLLLLTFPLLLEPLDDVPPSAPPDGPEGSLPTHAATVATMTPTLAMTILPLPPIRYFIAGEDITAAPPLVHARARFVGQARSRVPARRGAELLASIQSSTSISLSAVLRSPRAVQVSIEIVRALVRLRRLTAPGRDGASSSPR